MPRRAAKQSAEPRRRRRRDPFAEEILAAAAFTVGGTEVRACDRPGCPEAGTHRAPVSPDRLNQHYWFCLDHVREYNRAWNYCAGRSEHEIESMIREDIVGWRPTWPLGRLGGRFARGSFASMKDGFGLFEDEAEAEAQARAAARERARRQREKGRNGHGHGNDEAVHEREALDLMELKPPVTLVALKARYKELVKRHHPDANGGDKGAEERLKLINQAYATLKQSLGT